jgi:ribosome recycling factor
MTMPMLQLAKERMNGALDALRREFATVRTGKATPSILDSVRVEAYGSRLPLNQVASISTPEGGLLLIQPFDRSLISAIERGIQMADLGLNPGNDGAVIRIPIPPLNEERRKEFVKVLHRMAEEARVSIRHARREANEGIKAAQKESGSSEDDVRRGMDEVQKVTDEHIRKVDELLAVKEKEVLQV